ncbi:cell division protein ZipA C-terminal FtsZ-binding domain-containing protein [Nitrosomonas sp. ANs5]|uniref:cell division protein ZipA C-terminal FtsZ-binding domain-containing protein n=1 Tax=Nitrosomonas sp. ANs5 TaxID=3423941 RepID=UPI003D358B5A
MSDLQISLIIIGVVVIAGVVVFNQIQQARYHRKVRDAFKNEHDDALLSEHKPLAKNERIEPQFNEDILPARVDEIAPAVPPPVSQPKTTAEAVEHEAPASAQSTHFDNKIYYIVDIRAHAPIPHEKLMDLLQQKFDFGKPVHWHGQTQDGQAWEEITLENAGSHGSYGQLKGCLQLADRSGPVSEINLSRFRDMVEDFAAQVMAEADCPEITKVHDEAVLLDRFCADVDVIMGVNIISKDGGAFVGTKIRALAEASGFRLESEGVFKYRDSETNNVLFSLANFESTPFSPSNMRTLATHGVTFLLDVPRVANGEKVFDQMAHIARLFSSTLNGILVDDNRVPLSDNAVTRSRQKVAHIQSIMATRDIPAGSEAALKLFD